MVKWRRRYAEAGLAGLEDAPRPGGPRRVLTAQVMWQILAATVTPPPESLRAAGLTHWSSRRLADWLRQAKGISVSHDSITVLWRKFCLRPHRTEGFKFSTDPQLKAKVRDVLGLYLAPPQKRDRGRGREAPDPGPGPNPAGPADAAYVRHGTTALFAALEVATGTVTDACYPRHRLGEFLRFLKKAAATSPAASCGWCATTTPPTSTPRSAPGWPDRKTSGSPCTSCPPAALG